MAARVRAICRLSMVSSRCVPSHKPVMPPSSAYGLFLNLAAIDMRQGGNAPTTLIRPDVPLLRLAIGMLASATQGSLYQQLHTYPIGTSGASLKPGHTGRSIGLPRRGVNFWWA